MNKKIAIIGADAGIMSAAVQLQLAKLQEQGIKIISTEQANDQGLIPIGTSFQQRIEDILITPDTASVQKPYKPPLSRYERRKQERENRKKLKY